MDVPAILLINLIVGAASFVTTLSGFGYALVATPFMVLLFPPQIVVPVVLLSSIPLSVLLAWESHREMSAGRIGRWLVGAAVGGPLGVYGLASIQEEIMRQVIGGITLLAVLMLWLKPVRPFQRESLPACMAGCLSGVAGGASGMSGPPIILFGLNQEWEHGELRANLIGYFTILHTAILVLFGYVGILDADTLVLGGWALPGMLIGYAGGVPIKQRVSGANFRILALGLVGLGGMLALAVN